MTAKLLLTSAGRRVGLLECFRRSAEALNLRLEILACDIDPHLSAACRIADKSFEVPRCDDPGYADRIAEIVGSEGVGLIVPTIDPELGVLAEASDMLAEIGARVHVSPPAVVKIAADKLLTIHALAAAGVPVPQTWPLEAVETINGRATWPMLVKPRWGSASRGIGIVLDPDDLPKQTVEPIVIQELLKGPEYTVNMFIDSGGNLRSVVPHRRLRVRAGEVEKGRTERVAEFEDIAQRVFAALPNARGALCFQLIVDAVAGAKVFEINARFGGGYPLAHNAGATFTQWLIEETFGLALTANANWRDGVVMIRYDAAVFDG
jgi:carbamoyl-phosphate synthase large subunit